MFVAAPTNASSSSPEQRGLYLATLGDCAGCHTTQYGAPFTGGYPLHTYFGTVYSSNITPDRTTGIGGWTAAQFYSAMHDGTGADGDHLYPAMPYPYFTRVGRSDSDAIFAYLKTLKPIRSTPPPNKLIFPTNIRLLMVGWNLLFLDKTPIPREPRQMAERNRGSEIVNELGHCGACHTPKNVFFADQAGKLLQGETVDNWFASNLTPTPGEGLDKWTAADIALYLKTGSNRFGRVTGSMQDVVRLSTSQLTDEDRTAIAIYLKSLPAAPEPAPGAPVAESMSEGEAIFVPQCSACHLEPGAGEPRDYPSLAGNSLVMARDPTTVLRIVLRGSQSIAVSGGRIGFSMPGFADLSDREIAAVATFIRNSWGNRAKPVAARDATRLRAQLVARGQ